VPLPSDPELRQLAIQRMSMAKLGVKRGPRSQEVKDKISSSQVGRSVPEWKREIRRSKQCQEIT
jgi:hypothetical protein